MGMFDTISYQGKSYQTKCLKCLLDEYRITEDGRLVTDYWHLESAPESDRPYPNAPQGSLLGLVGIMRRIVDKRDIDTQHHGWIEFYDSKSIFRAKFTDGQLVSIDYQEIAGRQQEGAP